jgi:hypothetical protein
MCWSMDLERECNSRSFVRFCGTEGLIGVFRHFVGLYIHTRAFVNTQKALAVAQFK